MLALHPRRQHIHHPYTTTNTLPSPPPSDASLYYNNTSPSHNIDESLLHNYLESLQPFQTENLIDSSPNADPNQYMTGTFDFANPAIRIQQSTPVPQLPVYSQSMLPSNNSQALHNWNSYESNGQIDTTHSLQTPAQRAHRQHQRATSSSSIGSNGSQYHTAGHATSYPYVANSENSPSAPSNPKIDSAFGADESSRFSNHLPTPSHTPTQDSFLNTNFSTYSQGPSMDSTMGAHMSMKQALMDQHNPDEEVPGFGHSGRHSVSSYGQDSPATPHTAHGEDFEDKFKVPPTGMTVPGKVESWFDDYLLFDDDSDMRHHVPKFDQLSDMGMNELYNPPLTAQMQQSALQTNANPSLLSPYRNVVNERLQAAQNARSQSPASSASRGVSPFRHGSPYAAPSSSFSSPHTRVGTAAHQREVAKAEADAHALKRSMNKNIPDAQPTTISPKDALLDFHEDEDSKAPLFPDSGANDYDNQYNATDQYRNMAAQPQYSTSEDNYRRQNWATTRFSPQNFNTSGPAPPQTNFTYVPPSIPGNMHGLPFHTQQYRPATNMAAPSETPDFPAHLTSMESSASEGGPETGSTASDHFQKPVSSAADSGTYTCTYHGCTLRFETPQKLQKHKREGHRQNPVVTTSTTSAVGSGMTSAALLERNSQAGPHKCERINPTTGKPCNTIFSRPYDLTRHEDTIHNIRKQKVRCALCVEEKTFSRNDALTRHMRVVHPEVDFPGKHRRRGGNHD
ncbi:hypothetical protein BU16DRAFT_585253 [Lophium mytilinum]|uniref:C2H2-type domain-containing protein n=1 Tax=Lophium mytilinum TaxID=390894 RepID=A0A6A6QFX6_9PEZI|nr:hypothetical protein BU16DRAFT_585253 [Lophium mytilinum]